MCIEEKRYHAHNKIKKGEDVSSCFYKEQVSAFKIAMRSKKALTKFLALMMTTAALMAPVANVYAGGVKTVNTASTVAAAATATTFGSPYQFKILSEEYWNEWAVHKHIVSTAQGAAYISRVYYNSYNNEASKYLMEYNDNEYPLFINKISFKKPTKENIYGHWKLVESVSRSSLLGLSTSECEMAYVHFSQDGTYADFYLMGEKFTDPRYHLRSTSDKYVYVDRKYASFPHYYIKTPKMPLKFYASSNKATISTISPTTVFKKVDVRLSGDGKTLYLITLDSRNNCVSEIKVMKRTTYNQMMTELNIKDYD